MTRYARQICLPEIGPEGQARLAAARVLVVGAGGLGSAVLPLLAGAGLGVLRLFDGDRVAESNLHRQTLFRMADLGQPKAEVAARSLCALNPDCAVEPVVRYLDPVAARSEVAGADLVLDAADNFATSYALSDACQAAGVPMISASVLERRGYAGGFCAGAPSLRALFPDLPATAQTCASGGVMGPAVALLGALQAQMALSVLLGHRPSPLGQMVTVDLASWRMTGFRFDAAPEPENPGPAVIGQADLAEDDLVVDLRAPGEGSALPGAIRPDAGALAALAPAPGQRVVFVCASGLRAWRAAQALAGRTGAPVAILALP